MACASCQGTGVGAGVQPVAEQMQDVPRWVECWLACEDFSSVWEMVWAVWRGSVL